MKPNNNTRKASTSTIKKEYIFIVCILSSLLITRTLSTGNQEKEPSFEVGFFKSKAMISYMDLLKNIPFDTTFKTKKSVLLSDSLVYKYINNDEDSILSLIMKKVTIKQDKNGKKLPPEKHRSERLYKLYAVGKTKLDRGDIAIFYWADMLYGPDHPEVGPIYDPFQFKIMYNQQGLMLDLYDFKKLLYFEKK